MNLTASSTAGVGELVREWRQRRRMSQLELAGVADISARHLSFVETGRASPSRSMLIRLAERLDVPLRARNQMLHAAGYAALYAERPLDAPEMTAARQTVEAVLAAHMPFPALAVDRHWHLVAANEAVGALLAGIDAELLAPPLNVLRLSLHPRGLAPRIANLGQWRAHLLERLQQQIDRCADARLAALHAELVELSPPDPHDHATPEPGAVAVPLRLRVDDDEPLAFLSTTTVFGTPVDVTLSELALECFYPADERTRRHLQGAAGG
jgi:transcriptional regulator with XRE-family HTH domain